jgi:ribosomal-protein-alanine N-acetyltransferase
MAEADLDTVLEIEGVSYDFPWTRGIFRDCLQAEHYCQLLIDDGHIIGYCVMSTGAGEAHVLNVCVHPRQRQQGWGRYLLRQMVAEAARRQADLLLLEVRISNQSAIHLYDSLGFNEIGLRRNYYPSKQGREDALLMALQLISDTLL